MEYEILAEKKIDITKSLFISTLSSRAFDESGCDSFADHSGYFLYERYFSDDCKGIEILAKMPDFEAAMKMANMWGFEELH